MMSEYVGLLCKLLHIYKITVLYNHIKITSQVFLVLYRLLNYAMIQLQTVGVIC